MCQGLEVCVAENDDGWKSRVSGGSATLVNFQLLYMGKRITFLRQMLYINVVLAIEITNKYYFDISLRHQSSNRNVEEKKSLIEVLILVESFSLLFPVLLE